MLSRLRALLACFVVNFVALFRSHDCKTHGHRYSQRYDDLVDPRLSADQVAHMVATLSKPPRVHLYVRDICEFCGDVIDRTEGEHPLKALARQAK